MKTTAPTKLKFYTHTPNYQSLVVGYCYYFAAALTALRFTALFNVHVKRAQKRQVRDFLALLLEPLDILTRRKMGLLIATNLSHWRNYYRGKQQVAKF